MAGNRSGNLLITNPTPSPLSHLTPFHGFIIAFTYQQWYIWTQLPKSYVDSGAVYNAIMQWAPGTRGVTIPKIQ